MERKEGTFTVAEILPLIGTTEDRERSNLDGDLVRLSSFRLRVFKDLGVTCQDCGLQGSFFAKERHTPNEPYHLNLYALEETTGEEVLITHDHIIPLSKGGKKTYMGNIQVLCFPCNLKKGAKV